MSDNSKNTVYASMTAIILIATSILAVTYLADILIILLLSILASMLFNPIVSFLENKGIERTIAVLITFSLNGLFLFVIGSVLIPKLINQFNAFSNLLNEGNILTISSGVENTVRKYFPFINTGLLVEKFQSIFNSLFLKLIDNLSTILSSLVNIVIIAVIIPFITFFILRDNKLIMKSFVNLVPNRLFEFSYTILNKTGLQLGKFIRGWILDASIVGTLIIIGLTLLGINNSITIGFIAGVGHLVPYFGPIIGGIPAIILSLIQFGDLSKLPQILILFVLIYTIDNGFIQPKIYSNRTGLHPILIIILILSGNQLLGPLGMLLAIPLATIIKTASTEFYNNYKKYKIIKL
ncbi:MAG: AI-2E family transporter [Ignavibacteriales bacterium]